MAGLFPECVCPFHKRRCWVNSVVCLLFAVVVVVVGLCGLLIMCLLLSEAYRTGTDSTSSLKATSTR
jgi:hypothetical protein